MLIDTHAHLYLNEFDDDRANVIENAVNAGVEKIFLPNINSESIDSMLRMADEYPNVCHTLMGLHPSYVKADYMEHLKTVEMWLDKRPFCGVGEIGIDLYWDKTYINEQIDAFRFQLDLSLKHNLPTVIHARNSIDEIFEVLEEYKGKDIKGIFHCFPGNTEQAQKAISYGYYIGIGGVVTFKNSNLDKVVESIPLEHIVLETDSPYLAPTPHRGKRNESANIAIIAKKVAEIHNKTVGEVASITSKNVQKIFDIT